MLLATRCPFCETVFRLLPVHLSARRGLVRCGHCQQVFDASGSLYELPASGDFRAATVVSAETAAALAAGVELPAQVAPVAPSAPATPSNDYLDAPAAPAEPERAQPSAPFEAHATSDEMPAGHGAAESQSAESELVESALREAHHAAFDSGAHAQPVHDAATHGEPAAEPFGEHADADAAAHEVSGHSQVGEAPFGEAATPSHEPGASHDGAVQAEEPVAPVSDANDGHSHDHATYVEDAASALHETGFEAHGSVEHATHAVAPSNETGAPTDPLHDGFPADIEHASEPSHDRIEPPHDGSAHAKDTAVPSHETGALSDDTFEPSEPTSFEPSHESVAPSHGEAASMFDSTHREEHDAAAHTTEFAAAEASFDAFAHEREHEHRPEHEHHESFSEPVTGHAEQSVHEVSGDAVHEPVTEPFSAPFGAHVNETPSHDEPHVEPATPAHEPLNGAWHDEPVTAPAQYEPQHHEAPNLSHVQEQDHEPEPSADKQHDPAPHHTGEHLAESAAALAAAAAATAAVEPEWTQPDPRQPVHAEPAQHTDTATHASTPASAGLEGPPLPPDFASPSWDPWAPPSDVQFDEKLRYVKTDLPYTTFAPAVAPMRRPKHEMQRSPFEPAPESDDTSRPEPVEPAFTAPPEPVEPGVTAPLERELPPPHQWKPAERDPQPATSAIEADATEPGFIGAAAAGAAARDSEPHFGSAAQDAAQPHTQQPAHEPAFDAQQAHRAEPLNDSAAEPFAAAYAETAFAEPPVTPHAQAQAQPFAAPLPDDGGEHFAVIREPRMRSGGPLSRTAVGVLAAIVLVLLLIAQLAWWQRETVMVYWPASQSLFASACAQLGCTVTPPRDIDGLVVEPSDLREIDNNPHKLELRMPLRNRFNVALAYPAVELTLLDEHNNVVVRRVLLPQDYVRPGTPISAGMPARTSQTMIVRLDLGNAVASNFLAQIFYP